MKLSSAFHYLQQIIPEIYEAKTPCRPNMKKRDKFKCDSAFKRDISRTLFFANIFYTRVCFLK